MTVTLLDDLRTAYDQKVAEREQREYYPWKAAERARFLAMVQGEARQHILEIGAGTGHDSLFLQTQGLTVTAVDLSPAMVQHCRDKGLHARVVAFAELDEAFAPATFDAIYAVNSLLHVPKADLPSILAKIHTLLVPDGLFYWGQYGGVDEEGIWPNDHYEPKRFFARYTDEQFQALPQPLFTIEAFCAIQKRPEGHFHSLLLRK